MKKVLLGSTALVAAGLVASQADAASGLKLGISGYYRGAVGGEFGSSDGTSFIGPVTSVGGGDWGRQNVSFRQEVRVNFTGSTTLDNGITVGVLVGLNGENVAKSGSTTQVNRAYADFSGKFGLVRVGEANSALVTDCVVDPGNVTSNFGVNSPNESFSNVGFAQVRNKTKGTSNVSNTPAGYFSTFGVAPMGIAALSAYRGDLVLAQAAQQAGVPAIMKDVLSTRGVRTTCGSRMLENFVPIYDATVIRKLYDAGMVANTERPASTCRITSSCPGRN